MIRKLFVLLSVAFVIITSSTVCVHGEEIPYLNNSVDEFVLSLPDNVRQDMNSIGAGSADIDDLSDVSFDALLSLVVDKLSVNSKSSLSTAAVVIGILMMSAMFESYTDSLKRSSTKEVVSLVTTLCVTTTLVLPVLNLINTSITTVTDAANFMLLYIPVMVAVLTFSGQTVTASSYYSLMILACQGISQLCVKFISPLLNVYLGFCVSASITERVNLKGFCSIFSKVIKWLISFTMTVFSALMTIRSLITTAYDSVTTRAVRFTMSSFIPIVGAALSESYKTIQGSINLLRTGAGVFVILAIIVVFLPTVTQCVMWLFSINLCKSIGELIGVTNPVSMLGSISSVVSTVFAITVCIMALFVISTALLITLGGGSQ